MVQPLYTHPYQAQEMLVDQASVGLLASWAKLFILQPDEGEAIIKHRNLLPLGFWQQFDNSSRRAAEDWTVGNFSVSYPDDISAIAARAFGVMFAEDDLRTIPGIPARNMVLAPQPDAYDAAADSFAASLKRLQTAIPEVPTRQKKPVSPATLKSWWQLALTLRPADQWTTEEMRAFFNQCLPDKSVSRDQLREARGHQKSGPKTRAAE